MSHAIVVDDLHFSWPDGGTLFDGLSFTVGPGRTALIGVNGSGKSALLRLIAGELVPSSGSVRVGGRLGYLPQDLTLDPALPIDEVLGIAQARWALRAIERGEVAEELFAAVGDEWDVEERARATLDRLGLGHLSLDRRVGEVSGGETVLLGLAALFLRRPDVLLLDEPTNNLDLDARGRLRDAVLAWPGVMLLVSHDRALLDLVDQVADLRDGRLRWYGGLRGGGGGRAGGRPAAGPHRRCRCPAPAARVARRRIKLDRRRRYGQKMWDTKREPKIIMGARKRQAEVAAGKHRGMHLEKLEESRQRLTEAEEAVHDDDEIRVDLPGTEVPAGRTVLELRGVRLRGGALADLELRGPERVALLGANGAGKTTLLETSVGALDPLAGSVTAAVPLRYLPQRLDVLDDRATVAANVARFAPGASDNAVRARLARFLFRGRRADQPVGTLSGGERFRATLAALLLAEPPPQLLLLDEPTNNLDLASTRQLTEALAAYRGALLVASHDLAFLRGAGITRWLRLEGRLLPVDPP